MNGNRILNASRFLAACALKLIARRSLHALRDFEPYILKSVHGPGCYQSAD
jgi:hypothetical protein